MVSAPAPQPNLGLTAFEKGGRPSAKPRVLVISGPTAVGKSALALELAQRLGGEIIGCDSVQVYRGLNVGSAKTPVSERRGVPHHLLDIKEPTEEYTAGDFYRDARAATEDVLRRGKVPIVVGGTGLYLRWFIHGTPETPKASPELAARIEAQLEGFKQRKDGWREAVAHLAEAGDPKTGAELAPNDWYRMRRALEIVLASGKPKSEFQLNFVKAPHKAPSKRSKRNRTTDAPRDVSDTEGPAHEGLLGQDDDRAEALNPATQSPQTPPLNTPSIEPTTTEPPSNQPPGISSGENPPLQDPKTSSADPASETPSAMNSPLETSLVENPVGQTLETPSTSGRESDYDFRCYFLFGPRRELYRKIDERCEQMVVGGLLEEASELLDMGVRADTCMPARAIGYRQALEYLEECRKGGDGVNGGPGAVQRFLRFVDEFQQASRKYAKRQLTWFRSEGSFFWLDASQPTAELADRISTDLDAESSTLDAKKGLIPDSWLSREQERELRAYRTERKIFHDDLAIARVLMWVNESQRKGSVATGDESAQPTSANRDEAS